MYLKVYGGLFDFSVSLNQTNWFIVVSVERLRFGFELDNIDVNCSVNCNYPKQSN